MARIGKCRKCKKGWVVLGSYASNNADATGFCKVCFTEHRLEFCHNRSNRYRIMKNWVCRKGE